MMSRTTGIGLGGLILAMVAVFLSSTHHLDRPSQPPSLPAKVPRVTEVLPQPRFTGTLPPARPPADRKANILHLLQDGEVRKAQTAISEWYTADPDAAGAWLENQPSWEEYQPAISQIAKEIAETGYPMEALEWAKLLNTGENREETIFAIYATGRRYNWLTDEEIRAAPFSQKKVEDLLNGAADD